MEEGDGDGDGDGREAMLVGFVEGMEVWCGAEVVCEVRNKVR